MAAKEMLIAALAHFLAKPSNRVLELTPEGVMAMAAGIRSTWRARDMKRRGCMGDGNQLNFLVLSTS
jgi:hypothetical protein